MEPKTLKVTVEGKKSVALEKLEPFQEDLKHLEKEEYERLRASLIHHGIAFVVHVWEHDGHLFIIDGHQRVFVMNQLKSIEGYDIPKIPIALVTAKSYEEAKQRVLAGASSYGVVSEDSLAKYLSGNKLDFVQAAGMYSFHEVDFTKISSAFHGEQGNQIPVVDETEAEKTSKSGSDQVRQLQLYFGAEDYVRFVQRVEELQKLYKTENITDTLIRMVDEIHSIKLSAK